ncbi:MAG: hypothetical protein ACXWRE_01510 [Pseudobdellovibrionaceae bacterium]
MTKLISVVLSVGGMMGFLFLSGCASSTYKARQEQREKIATSAGLYCEWINGDKHSDIDVELNLQMGKRCDSAKPFALTPYKNTSDQNGIMYCCATTNGAEPKSSAPISSKKKSTSINSSAEEIVEDK